MDHLNNTEIVDFVNISEFSETARELVKRVNSHIMSCPECAMKVRRAARSADVMAAVMKDGFSLRDACFSAYDIPAEAVRLEAKTALADETELEEESAARY